MAYFFHELKALKIIFYIKNILIRSLFIFGIGFLFQTEVSAKEWYSYYYFAATDSTEVTTEEGEDEVVDEKYKRSKRSQSKETDRYGDPLINRKKSPLLSLPNPSNIQTQIELDSGNTYTIYEKLGNGYFRSPSSLSFDDFLKIQEQRYFKNYIKSKSSGLDGESIIASKRLIPKIYVSPLFDRIFGGNYIDIRPNGFATLDFGAKFQRVDNPTIPLRQQRNGGFSFDQQLSMNLIGKLGEKATITANWDTKSSFQFENNIKFDYTGFEEDIIKKIEAGNVSLPITNSLIQGGQNLFGIKTQLQFGKLWVTSIASTQRSKTEGIKINGGVQNKDFEIRVDNYEDNRHFFLSHFFRDNYEKALKSIPNPTSGVTITRVEVYVINRTNNTETIRNIAGFTDLAEGNKDKLVNKNPSSLVPIPGPASNSANNLYQTLLNQATIRDVDQLVNSLETTLGMVKGTDFERITGARKLTDREFRFQPQLGYISLNTPIRNDEAIAVSYEYTYQGRTYKVGELTEDYQNLNPNQIILLKLIRPSSIKTNLSIWDLMMKNIYSINSSGGISRQNFQLRVIYKDDLTGIDNPSLHEGIRMKDVSLLEIFKLDRLNPNNDPQKDGNFDWIDGITVDASSGRIIFPVLEPFGSYLTREKWLDPVAESNLVEKYVFNEIYRNTRNDASLTANKNKFFLKGSFQSNSSSEIRLGFAPTQGSVSLTAGNTVLTEGVDFIVDYDQGIVRIINEGIKNSGKEINVRYEKPDFFNFQTRTLLGSRFDYKVDKDITFGGTVLYLNERPNLTRVNIGDEPMRNTMWGLDVNYRRDSKALTRIIDYLPFLRTKELSTVSFTGEFAQLIPGTSKIAKGNSYIDDFESSEIGINLDGQATNWKLSATPQKFPQGSAANPLEYTYKRAKLAWYNIDPIFYGGSTRPKNISEQDIENQYVRGVIPQEVFKGKAKQQIVTPQQLFDIAYYPSERGAYNYNTDLTADGKLKDPKKNWGGITKAFTNDIDFDNLNVEYIEFWVMDPFIQGDKGIVYDGIENKNNTTGGKLYFNLGSISEDVLKDGRHAFENGLPIDGNPTNTQLTPWGRMPKKPYINDVFENTPGARAYQDIGWDGLTDDDERNYFQNTFLNKLTGISPEAFAKIQNDPSGDNFDYYLGGTKDALNQKVLERYKNFNGMQGNSPENQSGTSFFPSSSNLPDNEDVNRDNTINDLEEYYEYELDLKPGQLTVGQNYIVDKVDGEDGATWYQFRVPIRQYKNKVGNINGFKTIRFVRMYLTEFEQPVVLRFFQLHLVSTTWRKFTGDLVEKGLVKPLEPYNPNFVASIVGIEKNNQTKPNKTPYVVPPGLQRDIDITSNINRQLNEQSIQLCVENLKDRDARAIFKNTSLDLINYGTLRMFIHAESYESTKDYETTAFLRLGTDFTENYYEVEVPLKITPNGTTNEYDIWPEENEIAVPLNELYLVKSQRNANQIPLSQPYQGFSGKHRITVVGNPDLSSVQITMIGVRNPKSDDQAPKSICIWANELRATDFNQTAGWASTGRLNMKLADLATVTGSVRYTSFGFGSIQDKISQRTRDYTLQYDISSNIAVDKLLPQKAGLRIPMFVSYDNKTITPKFNPFDPDVPLAISLDAIQNENLKQQYLQDTQDQTTRRSINFTNVQKIKTGKKTKNHIYDIENFSFTYAYSDVKQSNLKIKSYLLQTYKGGVGYNFNANAFYVEPFKKMKFLSSPYLKLIKDFNFSLFPNSIAVRGDLDRRFMRTELRSSTKDLQIAMAPFFEKYFTFNRNYDVRWNLTQNLALDYNATSYSIIDEPEGDINTQQKKDSIITNLKKLGRMKNFNQRIGANYRIPIDKIPFLDWCKLEGRYAATYTWTAGAVGQSDTLGNLIKNSSEQGINGKIDLLGLYNKNKFLRESLQPFTAVKKNKTTSKDSTALSKKDWRFLKSIARLVMTVRSIDLTFSNRLETTLPGFKPVAKYGGMDENWNAPGIPFLLGSQDPNIRLTAAENGWLVKNENINNPFVQNITTTVSARASLEPFRDFRIQLDAKRNTTGTYQEIFRYNATTNVFTSFNPSKTGTYSVSFIGIRTLFAGSDNINNSTVFKSFEDNRSIIQQRLQNENPYQLGGTYDANSQDVLIPSFIAAYSGANANQVGLSPFYKIPLPNWRIDYAGLSRLGFLKNTFSSITLTHSYSSSYNAGNFTSSLSYTNIPGLQLIEDYPFSSLLNQYQAYIPLYVMNQIIISDQLSPLIGINIRTKSNLTLRLDYKLDRNVGLNLSNAQVTELLNKEWVIGIGYTTNSLKLPFRVEGRTVILKNDATFRCDIAIRDSKTILRKFESDPTLINGNLSVQIRPTISYVINQRLTLQGYFQRELNNPRSSNAYKRINTAFGIQVRFSIAQ